MQFPELINPRHIRSEGYSTCLVCLCVYMYVSVCLSVCLSVTLILANQAMMCPTKGFSGFN